MVENLKNIFFLDPFYPDQEDDVRPGLSGMGKLGMATLSLGHDKEDYHPTCKCLPIFSHKQTTCIVISYHVITHVTGESER